MKFKALMDFKSSEFNGTQYVKDLTYTIRPGNTKLAEMFQKWTQAKRFIPSEDFSILGITFVGGKESYVLPGDDLEAVIDAKVAAGKAVYTGVGIVDYDFSVSDVNISGTAAKEIGV